MGRTGLGCNGEAVIASLAVLISGQPGSGKTTLAHQLAEALDAPYASFGDVVRARARHSGGEPTTAELEAVGRALIEEGWVPFCTMLMEHVANDADVFIVDGVRHHEAAQTLQELTGERPVWIFVEVDPDTRDSRIAQRDASRRPGEVSEMERAAAKLVSFADLVVRSPWDRDIVASEVRRMLAARIGDGS